MIFTVKDSPNECIVNVDTDLDGLLQAARNEFREHCTNRDFNAEAIRLNHLGTSPNARNRNEWTGGAYEDLFKMPDMRLYEETRKKLEKSNVMKKVVQKNNLVKRRKRSFSEHEGEWSMDRRWEIKPFSTATRLPTPVKFVDIYCYFNIHCGVGADEITRYGIALWAMNTVLETAGINTRVFYVQNANNVAEPGRNPGCDKRVHTNIKILLKEPSKYISPSALAKCLTSNFYRRVILSTMVAAVDKANQNHADGLGQPKWDNKVIEFKKGELHVYPDVLNAGEINIEKALLDVIEKA